MFSISSSGGFWRGSFGGPQPEALCLSTFCNCDPNTRNCSFFPCSSPFQSHGKLICNATQPWLRVQCSLGEGPFWETRTNTLRFIDIEKQELHSVDLNVGPSSHKVVKKMDISMGCTADIEGNDKEFIFGGKYGYGICNRETGEYRWIKKVWSEDEVRDKKPERMRANDGAVDSKGRYWVGFMNDPMVAEVVDEGMSIYHSLSPFLSIVVRRTG